MPSCQRRTAMPAGLLRLLGEAAKEREGGATEAGPEEDFVNHCGCELG